MLKIVYPICCGMDVHKSFLVACIASTNTPDCHSVTKETPNRIDAAAGAGGSLRTRARRNSFQSFLFRRLVRGYGRDYVAGMLRSRWRIMEQRMAGLDRPEHRGTEQQML